MGGRSAMALRALRFAFPYHSYIADFFSSRPELRKRTFQEQDAAIKSDFFSGAADSVTHSLAALGYDTRDYIFNAESAQKAWALERGLSFGSGDWAHQIARAQVLDHQPDVLFINPYSVPIEWLRAIRAEVPQIRVVVARHSSPRTDLSRFHLCELVVSGDSDQVNELRVLGINAAHHHHAFDRRILQRLPSVSGSSPKVLFSGQLSSGQGFHHYRAQVVRALVRSGVELDLRILRPHGFKAWVRRSILRGTHKEEALDRGLRRIARPPVFGMDMFTTMKASAVVLNVHGDVSMGEANNLRMWEATGVGSCLLTDNKRNLGSLFDTDREIVTFDSPEDCAARAIWLLENGNQRKVVALGGQQRVLKEHTYDQRALELDNLIRNAF